VPVLFTDASALSKRYLKETGSTWILDQLDPGRGAVVYISGLSRVEVASAIRKKERQGEINSYDADRAYLQFLDHLGHEYRIIEAVAPALEEAMALVNVHVLRAYDTVQLAAGLALHRELAASGAQPLLFLSADKGLNAVAALEGLKVENPNDYP
jgi:uncharacterized protein